MRTGVETGRSAEEGSVSFFKKRNKKLLIMLSLSAQPALAHDADWGLRSLMMELARVSSASARFTERKTMQVLSAPMLASGTLTYIAPDQIRKTTLSPVAEQFVLDHQDVSMTGGPGNQAQRFSLTAAPQIAGLVEGIRATLAGDLPTLERFYDVQLSGSESVWRLNLRPRRAGSARFVTSIDILGSQDRIGEIDTRSPNGDHSEMTISEDVRDAK
jgi:hypothetical protein